MHRHNLYCYMLNVLRMYIETLAIDVETTSDSFYRLSERSEHIKRVMNDLLKNVKYEYKKFNKVSYLQVVRICSYIMTIITKLLLAINVHSFWISNLYDPVDEYWF